MQDQPFRLPPLNALRVFWAVMRKGSFRSASEDLLVSPQAVSQQIRLLEDILDVPLFTRKGRVIEPTEQAIVLSHFVEAGFGELSEGIRRVTRAVSRRRININVSPYFATRFLMTRLDSLRAQIPGVDLRMTTMVETPDFARDEVDVSIQWGYGEWKDHEVRLVVRDAKIICCTPGLAERVRCPADLARQTLLHPVMSRDLWARVLEHLQVAPPGDSSVIEFHDAAMMRRATLSGIGVGLLSRMDAREDIRAGHLVAPLGEAALAQMADRDVPGFYLVLPRAHRRVGVVAAFCDWVAAENWSEAEIPA